jgi:hypothetical protein
VAKEDQLADNITGVTASPAPTILARLVHRLHRFAQKI